MSDSIVPDGTGAAAAAAYPLHVRDHGLMTAYGLLMRSMPYAMARFGLQMAYSVGCIVWLVVTFGGAAWLSNHIAGVFGLVWLVACVVGVGWFWATVLRYLMHLIECGHVAVLTELITRDRVGNGSESMFAYGKRIVTERFGTVNVLFGVNALVRGVLNAFHNTIDWIAEAVPIPGLEAVSSLINMVLKAATRYLDKVIFSYDLVHPEIDPWRGAREGIIYYCQNAKEILKTSIWIVIQERVLTVLLWLVFMVPAGMITMLLPHSLRESGGLFTVVIAFLLTHAVRAAFVKPLFLIMMMIRFHTLIENQPLNQAWDMRLSELSDKFRNLGPNAAMA